MEAFKAYEREAKTKAFSKEGLARQREKEMKGEEGRRDITEWLQDRIEELKRQMEVLESEIESEASKKKKTSTDVSATRLERHTFHLDGLEKLLRMWENEAIERDLIENVKDDIDYYVDNNQDDDFMENETIYDDLGLDDWDPEDVEHDYGDYEPEDQEDGQGDGITGIGADGDSISDTSSTTASSSAGAIGSQSLSSTIEIDSSHRPVEDAESSHELDSSTSSFLGSSATSNFPSLASSSSLIQPPLDVSSASAVVSSGTAGSTSNLAASGAPSTTTPSTASNFQPSATIGVPRFTAPTRSAEAELLEMAGLKASARYLPEPEPTKMPYKARNPASTPASYPFTPAQNLLDDPATFGKFPPDLLFFLFYFQQNTYQQYLAARELKRQSWRYHTKYLTWFQRHEDPKTINPEYEQGTYVYFDYETGWCQRKKSEFTFQYIFLEDNDLP